MKVLIKKSVLDAYIKENKSSRGDTIYNNTTGFYGNFGSVKSFNADSENEEDEDISYEDSPIEPNAQMAVQLSVDEPPVEELELLDPELPDVFSWQL